MGMESPESGGQEGPRPVLKPLSGVPAGSRVVIRELEGGRSFQQWATGMGITAGRTLEVVRGGGIVCGPVMVALGEARIAIGHGMARKILVEIPS